MSEAHGVGRWLVSRHVGLSSSALAASMLGYANPDVAPAYPHDAGDFGRCAGLWRLTNDPIRSEGLARLASISAQWKRLSDKWDALLHAYDTDDSDSLSMMLDECCGMKGSGAYQVRRDATGRWDRFRFPPTP